MNCIISEILRGLHPRELSEPPCVLAAEQRTADLAEEGGPLSLVTESGRRPHAVAS